MAAFGSLTGAQQTSVLNHMLNMRALVGQLSRLAVQIDSVSTAWANTNQALVTSLDAASIVPDASSLAGAQLLTREEVLTMGTNFSNFLATYNTQAARNLYVKTVGPLNAVGS